MEQTKQQYFFCNDKQLTKEELMQKLQDASSLHVEVQHYNTGDNRDSYFDKNSSIWEKMSETCFEDVEFLEDKVSIVRNASSYNMESYLSDILDAIEMSAEDIEALQAVVVEEEKEVLYCSTCDKTSSLTDGEDQVCPHCGSDDVTVETKKDLTDSSIMDMTLGEIETKHPDVYKAIIEIYDNLTDENFDIYDDGKTIFDCDDIDETIRNDQEESLAYWTVYFSPRYMDAEVASKCKLTPFRYDDEDYLALGGCGMDLSPKLDAYVALTHSHIPKDSGFFRESGYFSYVAGSEVMAEIEKKCKLDEPHYVIHFDGAKTK